MGESLTKRQRARQEQYKRGRLESDGFDWSDGAFLEFDDYESRGIPLRKRSFGEPNNGYDWAKRMMDVTITMWKEDVRDGLLLPQELLDDGYSEKFLKSVGVL
jgi:hypothetical protein